MAMMDTAPDTEEASEQRSFVVTDLPNVPNIAAILDKRTLTDIAANVYDEYKIDKESRADKEKEWDDAIRAFELKREAKSFPFDKASNIKFPLLFTAAMQFAARAMPALLQNGKVAKGKVIGNDPGGMKAEKAQRTADYLNYQLLERDDIWLSETDTMLHQIPIFGMALKKVYHDPERGNVSELVGVRDFYVNASYPSLDRAPRYTQRFELYPYEIEERIRDGRFVKFDVINSENPEEDADKSTDVASFEDKSRPHEFLEQHRRIDLDEDGYGEPYIVTLHVPTRTVVRIVACFGEQDITLTVGNQAIPAAQYATMGLNEPAEVLKIERQDYYVKYGFIPDPNGGFYDIGFGSTLFDVSSAISSIMNQIIDAGTLQNAGGGFIGKEFRMKAGEMRMSPGVYKQTTFAGDDIRKAIVPMQHPGPSAVLFDMLGFLVDLGDKVANTPDVVTGDTGQTAQTATTTLALIEQGLKVFTGIMGRMLRALNSELAALYKLNARYGDQREYQMVIDRPDADIAADFGDGTADVVPVADAASSTDMQRMAKAQVLMPFMGLETGQPDPMFNQLELRRRLLEAASIPNIDQILQQPQPDPVQQQAVGLDLAQKEADVQKTKAETVKVLTEASAKEAETGLRAEEVGIKREQGQMKAASDVLSAGVKREGQQQKAANERERARAEGDEGPVRGVAGEPGDGGVPPDAAQLLAGLSGAGAGPDVGGAIPQPGIAMPAFPEQGPGGLGGGNGQAGF